MQQQITRFKLEQQDTQVIQMPRYPQFLEIETFDGEAYLYVLTDLVSEKVDWEFITVVSGKQSADMNEYEYVGAYQHLNFMFFIFARECN